MEENEFSYGLGWLKDLPDVRDFSAETDTVPLAKKALGQKSVKDMLASLKLAHPPTGALKVAADLRAWCSPIEDQGPLGSCTAQAAAGMLEFYERRAFGTHIDCSRLFLYKVTRKLLGWVGDTGAYIRSTMGAMVLLGIPPEKYWPYSVANLDVEPTCFVYALAQNYQALSYYRLDPPGVTPANLLNAVKNNILAKMPAMFGFTVYNSINQAGATGKIPFPFVGDSVAGGHAVMAVGFDDAMQIKHANPLAPTTTGALLIRNSWGTGWGDHGYGWLPYDYVLRGLAVDWWALIRAEWVATGQFGY